MHKQSQLNRTRALEIVIVTGQRRRSLPVPHHEILMKSTIEICLGLMGSTHKQVWHVHCECPFGSSMFTGWTILLFMQIK